jgi:ABC-2 type transport system permease protein
MKSFLHYYLKTFKDIIANQSILTTLILSVIFYSVFYPTAYKAQQAEALPIVIVDEEQSIVTNNIIQQVSLSPNVEVKAVTGNFLDAENMIKQQQADGILLLPENLSNSLRHGEVGGIGLYLSAANFLKTKQIGLGLATSIENAVREHVEKFGNISHFSPTISIHQTPLFNTMSGYGSYIFPAIAPLIIHQTIVLGLGMLLAGYREQKWRPTTTEFFAIFCAILTIGMLGCLYLFGFIYWLNDYPHGGNFSGMLLAVPIFIGCIVALVMLISTFFDMPERAGHVIVFTSIPQLYTYFEPELQREFKTHEKDMRKFAKSIPKQAITTQKIVSKHIEKSTEKPSLYAVTYEYAYSNKNLVQYDVGFDKAGGSTKIRSFDVKLYGASTD